MLQAGNRDAISNGVKSVFGRAAAFFREVDPARLLALIVLIVYVPALTAIALMLVLTSTGPAFVRSPYRRENGDRVDLWEFRTECWKELKPTWVGSILRQTSLVRMPALVNVLKGEVGVGERVKAE
jgi:lipopolysaccharide/colanic/teichoic acid biosynthesis glycosyltransferase